MRTNLGLAAAALFLLGACVSPATGPDLDARLNEAGASVRGLGANFEIFPIDADSQMAAWTLAAESQKGEPRPLARQLARRMEVSAKRKTMLVVGGPYSSLTRTIVLDALALNEGDAMPGLVLVYVGSADSVEDIRDPAEKLGIRLVQRELP